MGQEQQALALAELAADAGTLTPEEAVALTLAVAERLGWSEPPSRPELIVVRGDGTVHLPRAADAVPATPGQYADLLQRLLAFGRRDDELRVPGPLLLLIARARGEIDLPRVRVGRRVPPRAGALPVASCDTRDLGCDGALASRAGGARCPRLLRPSAAPRVRASTSCVACCASPISSASRSPSGFRSSRRSAAAGTHRSSQWLRPLRHRPAVRPLVSAPIEPAARVSAATPTEPRAARVPVVASTHSGRADSLSPGNRGATQPAACRPARQRRDGAAE